MDRGFQRLEGVKLAQEPEEDIEELLGVVCVRGIMAGTTTVGQEERV